MSRKALHIVTFDVPYPPDYGGRMDVFFRIKALAEQGIDIHLHSFTYGQSQPREELEHWCRTIHYYPRLALQQSLPVSQPHIVASRRSEELLHRLMVEPYPILFEGLHTCYYIDHPALANRQKMVRMHNVEWEYYRELAAREPEFLRKQYLRLEAARLRSFETRAMRHAQVVLAISPRDKQYFAENHPNVMYLPAFHPHTFVDSRTGMGKFVLYHGKLSVAENHEAALWLTQEVFSALPDLNLIVAGADPRPELIAAITKAPNVTLRHNPSEPEMTALMHEAHIHALPTFQPTGIKLKLLNALFIGRHVLVNGTMVNETGLEELCIIADDAQGFRMALRHLYNQSFTESEIARRIKLLGQQFDNELNARKLTQKI